MSLETLCVKAEAEEVCVNEEAEECDNEETGAHVKQEAESMDSAGLCELYADHQIKDELVLGPVELHRPRVLSTLPGFIKNSFFLITLFFAMGLMALAAAECGRNGDECVDDDQCCFNNCEQNFQRCQDPL